MKRRYAVLHRILAVFLILGLVFADMPVSVTKAAALQEMTDVADETEEISESEDTDDAATVSENEVGGTEEEVSGGDVAEDISDSGNFAEPDFETDIPEENADALFSEERELEQRRARAEQNRASLEAWAKDTGRVVGGYIDDDYDIHELEEAVQKGDNSFALANMATAMPASYDARTTGRVSSVKDQADWGTCWAFQTIATAESKYKVLTGKEANLSESQLVYFLYNDDITGPDGGLEGDAVVPTAYDDFGYKVPPTQLGGNGVFTTFGMARWTGIADEATDSSLVYSPEYTHTTDELSIPAEYAYADALHLKNAYWISEQDRDSIKKAVMEFGTVGIAYYYDYYFDSDGYKYFEDPDYDGPAVYFNPFYSSTNHAVSIVGWDDNFDRNNFGYTYEGYKPANNGAWLIKNSWGTGIGDGGYFWLSYEDASIQDGIVFAYDYTLADEYGHNYQYDGSAGTYCFSTGDTTTAAAIYKANGCQTVDAVGIGFANTGISYTVKIYSGLTDLSNPESGTLVATQTGKTSYEGFYTIEMDEPPVMLEGERFSIVVEASCSSEAVLFADYSYQNGDWLYFKAKVNKGETFFERNNRWVDAAAEEKMTVRIKAFTNDYELNTSAADRVISDDMIEAVPIQDYNGAFATPEPKVVFDGVTLVKGTDYTLTYTNNDKVGTAQVIVKGKGNYSGEAARDFVIAQKTLTSDMIVTSSGIYKGASYDELSVYNGSVLMTKDVDYTVKYSKTPIEAGKYTVTVTGLGNYKGKATASITIEPKDLNDAEVLLEYSSITYSGSQCKPAVTVKIDGKEVPTANYSVKYSSNTNAGTATVTVTGKKSCKASVQKQFTINRKNLDAEDITATVANAVYSGAEQKPKVTVKKENKALKAGKDYSVDYTRNVNASENAEVTITGAGNYQGVISLPFTIAPKAVPSNAIKAELRVWNGYGSLTLTMNGKAVEKVSTINVYKHGTEEGVGPYDLTIGEKYDVAVELSGNYSGSALIKVECKTDINEFDVALTEPEVNKVHIYNGKAQKPAIIVKNDEGEVLSSKYYSVTYKDNINAGTATITVTGKGSYAGSKNINFHIYKKDLNITLTVSSIADQKYSGKAITPKVTVKDGKVKLKENKDYFVTYSDNENVAWSNGEAAAKAKAQITLSDNYDYTFTDAGKIVVYFKITPVVISEVKAKEVYFKGEGVPVETVLTSVKAGKFIVSSDDYTIAYEDNTTVTTKAKVMVTAKAGRNYVGTKTAAFKITKEPLSKCTLKALPDQVYTGSAITLGQDVIALTDSSNKTIAPSNYIVTYKNNTKVGKATVTITAATDSIYSGKITGTFKIGGAQLSDVATLYPEKLNEKVYTGKAQTYTNAEIEAAVVSKKQGLDLKAGKAYKVSYVNNTKAGTAQLVLTGTGSFAGKVTLDFMINSCDIRNTSMIVPTSAAYNGGKPVYPEIKSISWQKQPLVKGRDYVISYVNATQRGIAAMKITGIGNYSGTVTRYYKIN